MRVRVWGSLGLDSRVRFYSVLKCLPFSSSLSACASIGLSCCFLNQTAAKMSTATASKAPTTPPAAPADLLLEEESGVGVSLKLPSSTCCHTSGFAETKMRACSRPEPFVGDWNEYTPVFGTFSYRSTMAPSKKTYTDSQHDEMDGS